MSTFDPNKLTAPKPAASSSKPRAERVFLEVTSYETPSDGFHYAVGHRPGRPDDEVKVRLNTVKERCEDRPKDSEEKIKQQYVSGEYKRDTIEDKAKANIRFLSFDDCYPVKKDGGIPEYRAHWPKTMSTSHDAEIFTGTAHIKLKDAIDLPDNKRTSPQAYVELIKDRAIATPENAEKLLQQALTIKDEQNRARDPLVIMRVAHEGKIVASPRIYPASEATKVFDQALGDYKDVPKKVDADITLGKLMEAGAGRSDFETRQLDTARAVVAGLRGQDEPKFSSPDENVRDSIRNLYYGVKQGALQVEVISAEKIDFGPDTRLTYLKDKDRPHLAAYSVKEQSGDNIRETPGYTNTVVAVHRHPDGEPYAVFASPEQVYPKMTKLSELPLVATKEATLEKAAAAEAKPEPAQAAQADESESRYDSGMEP